MKNEDKYLWWKEYSTFIKQEIDLAVKEGLNYYQIDANKIKYYDILELEFKKLGYEVSYYWNCAGGDTIYITW